MSIQVMKSFNCSLACLNLCFLLPVTAAVPDAGGPEDGLEVIISCEKPGLLLAEPLVVSVTLTNASPTNLSVSAALHNGMSWAAYMVSKEGHEFKSIEPLVVSDPPGFMAVMRPGETFRHDQMLVCNGRTDRLVFPTEGDYYIRVDYRSRKSNVLKIQVKTPESTAELKWTERLSSRDVLVKLTMPSWPREAAAKILRDCATETSTYAPYAAFALASGEKNKTNALVLFQKADIAGFPLRSQAILGQARIYEELGDAERARLLYERILKEFPSTAAAAEVRRIQ